MMVVSPVGCPHMMNLRTSIAIILTCCCWLYAAVAAEPVSADPLLEPIRAKGDLPALAAAEVHNGQIVAWGAVGFRRLGSRERVTLQDKWHIGSCTKSMTESVAGMLVERAPNQRRWPRAEGRFCP